MTQAPGTTNGATSPHRRGITPAELSTRNGLRPGGAINVTGATSIGGAKSMTTATSTDGIAIVTDGGHR